MNFFFTRIQKCRKGNLRRCVQVWYVNGTGILCRRSGTWEYLLLGKGEDATGGRKRESVTSDAMEALIGAIYLDGGFANAKEFINRFILKDLENKSSFMIARLSCRKLYRQKEKRIVYQLVGEEGPDHNKSFHVEVLIGGEAYGCRYRKYKKGSRTGSGLSGNLALKLKEGKV